MEFDEILREFGEFGTFQKIIVYLVLLPAVIPCGFHAYNQIFMSATPEHWCKVPALQNRDLSVEAIRNLSIPTRALNGVESYEECSFYDRNYSGIFDVGNAEEAPCRNGWVYDTSKYSSTVVTEKKERKEDYAKAHQHWSLPICGAGGKSSEPVPVTVTWSLNYIAEEPSMKQCEPLLDDVK